MSFFKFFANHDLYNRVISFLLREQKINYKIMSTLSSDTNSF